MLDFVDCPHIKSTVN